MGLEISLGIMSTLLPTGSDEKEVLGVGAFLLQNFPLVYILKPMYFNCIKINIVGGRNKKHLRDSTSTLASIQPLVIIPTTALWVFTYGSLAWGVLWPSYCLLCVSYHNIYITRFRESLKSGSPTLNDC